MGTLTVITPPRFAFVPEKLILIRIEYGVSIALPNTKGYG
jgi:hypothetical protein